MSLIQTEDPIDKGGVGGVRICSDHVLHLGTQNIQWTDGKKTPSQGNE